MRKFFLLISSTALLVSCGGSKKVTTATRTTQATSSKREIRKEVQKIETTIINSPPQKEEEPKIAVPISYNDRVQNYIATYADIAKLEMAKYGIPASITLAQGILESGAGAGELTGKAKNHFGIKCHNWKGKKVYHDDDLSQECFRKYEKASHSFRDHSLFLKNRKRYHKLFTYKISDYKSWAYGLRAAGYATDQKYPVKLISIIERYQLYAYDKEVLGSRYEVKETAIVKKSVPVKEPVVVVTVDKLREYTVQKGDTLYSISRKHKIKVAELKKYNNLIDNTIAVGQVLRVRPN